MGADSIFIDMIRIFFISILLFVIPVSLFGQVTQDLFMNVPPGIDSENEWIKRGYLDVTLYGADPTGTKISTKEINKAIIDARDYQLVCYFPSGTYLVDDTLTGMMKTRKLQASAKVQYSDIRYPITLVGARDSMPVIKLTGAGNNYTNASNPVPLIWMWSQNGRNLSTNPHDEQSNIFYNSTLKNFVIDIRGYAGAEGLRFSGAQGCTIENVTVLAEGAYSGFHGAVGQGGGTYNIKVIGGKHAFVYDNGRQQKYAIIAGASFINQTEEVFKIIRMGLPVTVAGFYIEKSKGNIFSGSPVKGGLSLVDGVIKYSGFSPDNAILPSLNSNLYIKNLYIKYADKIVNQSKLDNSGWDLVEECYICNDSKGMNLINGVQNTEDVSILDTDITEDMVPSEEDIRLIHVWDDSFVSIEDKDNQDFVNVKDEEKMSANGGPGPAFGDAETDDSDKLQWAIDHFNKVFLPKGRFVINKPIILKASTQLFGAGKVYSIIRAGKNWDYSKGKSMMKTVEDKEGTTSLSFLMLETDYRDNTDLTRLEWHVGQASLVKDISVGIELRTSSQKYSDYHNMIEISGPDAGGRFYGLHGENTFISGITLNPDYRHYLVKDTRQPLRFYGLNAERAHGKGQMDIINSKDVKIFYIKAESATGGSINKSSIPLTIRNSQDIQVFGYSGVTGLDNDKGAIEIYNCSDITISNMYKANTNGTDSGWNYIKEICGSDTYRIPASKHVATFKRDQGCSVSYVPNFNNEYFSVYPNPGKGFYTINGSLSSPLCSINVVNLNGKVVLKRRQSQCPLQVNIKGENNGIYLFRVNDEIFKIIKNE